MQQTEFLTRFRGNFSSLMTWEQLDAFWATLNLKAAAGWYIYTLGEDVPRAPQTAAEVKTFVREINALLRHDHDEDYCGIVYVDNKTDPAFVKIFDPHNLGSSCGSSKNRPLPGWIMSLAAPQALEHSPILPGQRRRWWRKLWDKEDTGGMPIKKGP